MRRHGAVLVLLAAASCLCVSRGGLAEQPANATFTVHRSSTALSKDAATRLVVTRAGTTQPLARDLRCRVIPAHADVGLRQLSENGCVVELFIDPERTRLSRFALDARMSVDVLIYEGTRRVAYLSTALSYQR